MTPIVIHGIPGSPFVRMPLLACEEKGVAWRLAPMDFGEHKAAAHLARQPFGRIPAMEHGDFKLYEAQAIMRYVDQAFDGPALVPADAKAAARSDQVMNIVDWYVSPSIGGGIEWNRLIAPMFDMPVDEAAVTAALPPARTCITALEDILDGKPYLAGDTVSLGDLSAIVFLEMLPAAPEGAQLLAGSPLLGWIERMSARPSLRNTTMEVLRSASQAVPA